MNIPRVALYILGAAVIIALILTVLFAFPIGCKTFKPTWEPKLPAICNMSLNEMQLFYASKDKSGAMAGAGMCYKILIRTLCQAETFGIDGNGNPKPVDYDDQKKFRNYSQCMKELE